MEKQKWNIKRQSAIIVMKIMLVLPAFVGWSGFLYPDLTFQQGVAEAYSATDGEKQELSGKEFYEKLLRAEPGQVRVKSRLLEFLCRQFSWN